MRTAALALVALTFLPSPSAADQRERRETETVDRTIAFSRGGTLKLKNFSGDVRITGTAGNDVVVHAVRSATRERLDNIKLDIQINGSTIEIEANQRVPGWEEKNNNVVETDFEIQAPAATILDLYTFSGDLKVAEMTADIQAKTFSGNIELDVSRATGTPDIKAETFSGDIKTHVPPSASGRVQFNTFSGDLTSEVPLQLHGTSRKNITADLGAGSGAKLEFKTFSGDLSLLK
jgi:lia operon protein LiaG